MVIDIRPIFSGDFTLSLPSDSLQDKLIRIQEITESLAVVKEPTACLVILNDANAFPQNRDPKDTIRQAFARTGRLTQFITPDDGRLALANQKVPRAKRGDVQACKAIFDNDRQQAIEKSITDLLRQLGVIWLPDHQKLDKHPLLHTPCLGISALSQMQTVKKTDTNMKNNKNKRQALPPPIFLRVDLITGKVFVSCSVFSKNEVPYREACLQMAAQYQNKGIAEVPSLKHDMITCRNMFPTPEKPLLILVQTTWMRSIWPGISDKSLHASHDKAYPYFPEAIDRCV